MKKPSLLVIFLTVFIDLIGFGIVLPLLPIYSRDFGEYILLYEHVQRSPVPAQTLFDFLQSTYEAGANLGGWNREALEGVGDFR